MFSFCDLQFLSSVAVRVISFRKINRWNDLQSFFQDLLLEKYFTVFFRNYPNKKIELQKKNNLI